MRLIDADALKKKATMMGKCLRPMVTAFSMSVSTHDIDDAPTVDAVPVVRCKDCKYSMLWRKPTDRTIGECYFRVMYSDDEQFRMVGADDFCSYGESEKNE